MSINDPNAPSEASSLIGGGDAPSLFLLASEEERLRRAFSVFDKDGDGYISTGELRAVYKELGQNVTEEELAEIVYDADENGDGQIDFGEFARTLKMGRDWFPLLIGILQLLLLGVYWGFGKYPSSPLDVATSLNLYVAFYKDVLVMILIGFGFLTAFLRRHRFGSLTFVMLATVLTVQLAIPVNAAFNSISNDAGLLIDVTAALNGLFTAASVLITFGVLIGKVNAMQLLILTVFEVVFQALNTWICTAKLDVQDIGGSIVIHCFGAYFGLAATMFLSPHDTEERAHYAGSDYISDTVSLLACFFLWIYWPSFNAAAAPDDVTRLYSIMNTLIALCASTLATLFASRLFRRSSKFTLEDIQNATLAGGVAIGSCAAWLGEPGGAFLIGMLAGLISVAGYTWISSFLQDKIGLRDTAGVHNLHGMPSVLGGLASAIVFGAQWDEQWKWQLAALAVTLILSIVSGALVGFLISKLVRGPRKLFDDQEEFKLSVLCAHAGDGCNHRECGSERPNDPRHALSKFRV